MLLVLIAQVGITGIGSEGMQGREQEAAGCETEREREGAEMVFAGLRDGLKWMPADCPTARSLFPLMLELERRLRDPAWPPPRAV